MEFIGNPILNDVLYGAKKVAELDENQICLHSKKIRFEIGNNKSRFSLYILSEEKVMWIDENIFLLTSIFKFESVEYKKKIINETKNSKILVDSF